MSMVAPMVMVIRSLKVSLTAMESVRWKVSTTDSMRASQMVTVIEIEMGLGSMREIARRKTMRLEMAMQWRKLKSTRCLMG
jgi:hypothetical protein